MTFDCAIATGLSLTGFIVMETIAAELLEIPSLTLKLKLSVKVVSELLF